MAQSLFVDTGQIGRIPVGVGKGLKIGNVLVAGMFGAKSGQSLCQLLIDLIATGSEFAAATGRAENTASVIQSTVPVGTGETGIQGDFINFAAIGLFQPGIQRIIGFPQPVNRKGTSVGIRHGVFLSVLPRFCHLSEGRDGTIIA